MNTIFEKIFGFVFEKIFGLRNVEAQLISKNQKIFSHKYTPGFVFWYVAQLAKKFSNTLAYIGVGKTRLRIIIGGYNN